MNRKQLKAAAFLVLILAAAMVCAGCDGMKYISVDSMNETELLETEAVAKLLNGNGANLMGDSDFPVDISLCKIYDTTPNVYFSDSSGLYYLFYEFDDYREADSARYQALTEEGYPELFRNSVFSYTLAGKNLCIYLWYPEFRTQPEGVKTIEGEDFRRIEKEILLFKEILQNKAFNKKAGVLTGRGNSWEVVMPVEYIYNVRQAKEEAGKSFSASKGQTYLKYIGEERKLPEVYEIQWQKAHGLTTMFTDEGSLLSERDLYGFRMISSNAPGFHPLRDESITVTITWGSGETEKIVCVMKKEISQ